MTKKFNINTFLKKRPLSWSAISSFEYDPAQWYESYIVGKRQSSPELVFGSYVDKKLQEDPTFLPDMPRYEYLQYKMKVRFYGIPLVGIPDGVNLTDTMELADYKTGKKKWDKKRADDTGQLTFYLFLLYASKGFKPEDFTCYIHWMETTQHADLSIGFVRDMTIKTFETKRTMVDVLKFGERIKNTIKEMEKYVRERV